MSFSHIISINYLFTLRPGNFSDTTQKWVLIFLAIVLTISIISWLIVYRRKIQPTLVKLFKKIYHLLTTTAITGFILFFFRYENIPLLGARFWWLLLLIGDLIWLGFIIKYCLKKLPQEKTNYQRQQEINKYLPK